MIAELVDLAVLGGLLVRAITLLRARTPLGGPRAQPGCSHNGRDSQLGHVLLVGLHAREVGSIGMVKGQIEAVEDAVSDDQPALLLPVSMIHEAITKMPVLHLSMGEGGKER